MALTSDASTVSYSSGGVLLHRLFNNAYVDTATNSTAVEHEFAITLTNAGAVAKNGSVDDAYLYANYYFRSEAGTVATVSSVAQTAGVVYHGHRFNGNVESTGSIRAESDIIINAATDTVATLDFYEGGASAASIEFDTGASQDLNFNIGGSPELTLDATTANFNSGDPPM